MSARPLRSVVSIIMNILVVVAVFLVIRLIVVFFGTLEAKAWGEAIVRLTDLIVIPFGIVEYTTPYGGVFDVDAALTIAVLLLAEWALDFLKSRA